MSPENRSNDGAPIAVHRAVDLLYEAGAWLHDVACGDAEFDAMHDALDGRLVPFADAALSEARSSLAAVERERDHLDKVRAGLRVQLIERTSQRDAALARIAAVEAENETLRAAISEHDKVRAELMREHEARRLNEWQDADRQIKALVAAAKSRNACHETGNEIDEETRCEYAPGLHRHVRAALAASPTPTGPEPWKCARPGRCACEPLRPGDEHCRWFPATPEPTEETP